MQEAATGKYILKISPLIISECVFVLMGSQFRRTKQEITLVLTSFINLKGVECEEKSVVEESLTQYSRKGIDFIDAYLAAHAKQVTPPHVISININMGVKVETPEQLLNNTK